MSKKLDEIENRELTKKLEELGLSEKESAVYLALLPRKNVGSSKLIYATGLHGQFVYDALGRLEELGLAKHVIENGRKKFSAQSPLLLQSLAERKRFLAENVSRQLQARWSGVHEQDFEVLQGRNAFVAREFALLEEMPQGSTVDVFGGGGDKYINLLGEDLNEYERLRVRKEIKVRYISVEGAENYLKIMAQTRAFFEYRIFPNLESGFVDSDIWEGKVVFNIYGDPPISFTIVSDEIAKSYRQFFDSLWALSRS